VECLNYKVPTVILIHIKAGILYYITAVLLKILLYIIHPTPRFLVTMSSTTQQLHEAITILFNPQSSAERKKQANVYLERASRLPETWISCRSIIEQPNTEPQIKFFCCNILYQKVRREWSSLPDNLQAEISSWLSHTIGFIAQGKLQSYHLVTQRLSSTLAASASLSLGGITTVVNLALSLLQANTNAATISVAINLLTPLPSEVNDAAVPRRRLNKLTAELTSEIPRVLSVVNTLLTQQNSPCFLGCAQNEKMCISVIQCAKGWTKAGVSLAILQSTNILSVLLQTLVGSKQLNIIVAVSELLVSSMLSESQWISETSPGDQSQNHATAVNNVMTTIVSNGRMRFLASSNSWNPLTSAGDDEEKLCRAICLVATRIAEISCYVVARGQHNIHLRLVEFIMECTSSPIRSVAILSQDFWDALSEVPTLERHVQLRTPVFVSLLRIIISQCRFLGEYTDEELNDIDSKDERYGAFRLEGGNSLLENSFYLLRSQYFEVAVGCMQDGGNGMGGGLGNGVNRSNDGGTSGNNSSHGGNNGSSSGGGSSQVTWCEREAAMWSIWAVARVFVQQQKHWADEMKHSVGNGGRGPSAAPTQDETEHCMKSSALLTQLMLGIASNPQSFSHPLLIRIVAKTIEALASWIDIAAESNNTIIQAVATYLVTSLSVVGAKNEVAKALQRIMNKCGRWMVAPTMLSQLIHQINIVMANLFPHARQSLVDGLATVVVQMANHDDAKAGLEALCNPILDRLEQALSTITNLKSCGGSANVGGNNTSGDLLENACNVVSSELKIFATAMNHVDHFKSHSRIAKKNQMALQKVAGNIMQRAWPIINSTLTICASAEIITEVFQLFHVLIRSMTPLMGGYVGNIVNASVSAYQQTLSHAALKCLTGVVESYGSTQVEQLRQMLLLLYTPTANALQGGTPAVLASRAETIHEFFLLLHRVGLFCSDAFILDTLSKIIPLATTCCTLKEFKPCKQVLLVLVLLLKVSPNVNTDKSKHTLHVNINQVMNANNNGSRLALTLLTSIATTAPSRLIPQHAEVLYFLACRYTNECQQWVFQFLTNLPNDCNLSPEIKQQIMGLLFDVQSANQNIQRHKKRFKGILADFSKICRGELTADALTGWMMSNNSGGMNCNSNNSSSSNGGVVDLC
jgi:hypothetical protein